MSKEQARKDYCKTCQEVAKIDKDAAQFLIGPARELVPFAFDKNLRRSFIWSDSPQGLAYWNSLFSRLKLNKG